MKSWFPATAIEVAGVAGIGAGIGIELATGGHLGYILITTGSCLVAGGSVLWAKIFRREG